MDNTELFTSLRKLIHVDLNQFPNSGTNKVLQPYKVGYYDAYRELYDNLLKLTKELDNERLMARKTESAISFLNSLSGYKVYKQNLHSKQPWLTKDGTSDLAVFHSTEEIWDIAKSKGWQVPDFLPEGFE
jgi:hypothetical protein